MHRAKLWSFNSREQAFENMNVDNLQMFEKHAKCCGSIALSKRRRNVCPALYTRVSVMRLQHHLCLEEPLRKKFLRHYKAALKFFRPTATTRARIAFKPKFKFFQIGLRGAYFLLFQGAKWSSSLITNETRKGPVSPAPENLKLSRSL